MKHLLNNISDDEKRSILEQHKGGMKIYNEKFDALINKRLGEIDLFEQEFKERVDEKTFSTGNVSDLPQEIKDRLFEIGQNSKDFISYRQTNMKDGELNDNAKAYYLMPLAQWSIKTALGVTNATMDEAIRRVANESYLTNVSQKMSQTPSQKTTDGKETSEERVKKAFLYFDPKTLSQVILDNYKRIKGLIISGKTVQ
jgi:hypothetical protein